VRHLHQAGARPIGCDVESRKIGVWTLFAEAREIRIDQPLVPLHASSYSSFNFLRARVNDEYIGPLHQPLENRLSARRFQIECDAALVAVGQMPLIGILHLRLRRELVPVSPGIARGRLYLGDLGAKPDRIVATPGPAM
jgi:hypothetical protein